MPAPRTRSSVYAALVPAAHRPTHRITIWQGPSSQPVTLDVYLDGDKLRDDIAGDALVTRDADGRWHWTGVDRGVTAFEVVGLPGRRPSADSRSQEMPLRIDGRDFTL